MTMRRILLALLGLLLFAAVPVHAQDSPLPVMQVDGWYITFPVLARNGRRIDPSQPFNVDLGQDSPRNIYAEEGNLPPPSLDLDVVEPATPRGPIDPLTTGFTLGLMGAQAADTWLTYRLLTGWPEKFEEANPLFRTFATDRGALIAVKAAAGAAIATVLIHYSRDPNLRRVTRWSSAIALVINGIVVVHNYRLYRDVTR